MIQLYFNSTYHIRFLAMNKVKICGQFDTSIFQRNLFAAKWAAAANLVELEVCEMFEFQWTQFCLKERDNLSVLWDQSTKCVITVDGGFDEEIQHFYQFCEEKFQYEESDDNDYDAIAELAVKSYKEKSGNTYCFIQLAADGKELEKIELELYLKMANKTCKNFAMLCEGVKGEEEEDYGYKNSLIHRIVPKGWIQGGDIDQGSKGDGGRSAFADRLFPDESFAVKHNSRGIIGMANNGPHSNQSQFYITLEAKSYLDKNFVAFGRVIRGSQVLDEVEAMETFNERPKNPLKIIACGQL